MTYSGIESSEQEVLTEILSAFGELKFEKLEEESYFYKTLYHLVNLGLNTQNIEKLIGITRNSQKNVLTKYNIFKEINKRFKREGYCPKDISEINSCLKFDLDGAKQLNEYNKFLTDIKTELEVAIEELHRDKIYESESSYLAFAKVDLKNLKFANRQSEVFLEMMQALQKSDFDLSFNQLMDFLGVDWRSNKNLDNLFSCQNLWNYLYSVKAVCEKLLNSPDEFLVEQKALLRIPLAVIAIEMGQCEQAIEIATSLKVKQLDSNLYHFVEFASSIILAKAYAQQGDFSASFESNTKAVKCASNNKTLNRQCLSFAIYNEALIQIEHGDYFKPALSLAFLSLREFGEPVFRAIQICKFFFEVLTENSESSFERFRKTINRFIDDDTSIAIDYTKRFNVVNNFLKTGNNRIFHYLFSKENEEFTAVLQQKSSELELFKNSKGLKVKGFKKVFWKWVVKRVVNVNPATFKVNYRRVIEYLMMYMDSFVNPNDTTAKAKILLQQALFFEYINDETLDNKYKLMFDELFNESSNSILCLECALYQYGEYLIKQNKLYEALKIFNNLKFLLIAQCDRIRYKIESL